MQIIAIFSFPAMELSFNLQSTRHLTSYLWSICIEGYVSSNGDVDAFDSNRFLPENTGKVTFSGLTDISPSNSSGIFIF